MRTKLQCTHFAILKHHLTDDSEIGIGKETEPRVPNLCSGHNILRLLCFLSEKRFYAPCFPSDLLPFFLRSFFSFPPPPSGSTLAQNGSISGARGSPAIGCRAEIPASDWTISESRGVIGQLRSMEFRRAGATGKSFGGYSAQSAMLAHPCSKETEATTSCQWD